VNLLKCVFVGACLLTSQVHAQALWGTEANTGQGDGQFDTGFTETGDANSLANSGWTALSINESGGSVTPGNAYWTRNLLGYSQGAYWEDDTPINSPSQANGVAIFDSDFLDNNGVVGNFGNGTSPSAHRGELISPLIDLTGNTDELIMLKFYSFYSNFQINELSIAASTDGGFSWGPSVDYRTYQADQTEGFIYVPFPADTLAGLSNLTAVRIKFIFDGDYYFSIVDDVTIMIYDEVLIDTIFTNGFDD
jgi:hypothetical protein